MGLRWPLSTIQPPPADRRAVAVAAARDTPGVRTALDWAEVAAMLGDFEEAVAWLDYVESQEGTLSAELTERRRNWSELVRPVGGP